MCKVHTYKSPLAADPHGFSIEEWTFNPRGPQTHTDTCIHTPAPLPPNKMIGQSADAGGRVSPALAGSRWLARCMPGFDLGAHRRLNGTVILSSHFLFLCCCCSSSAHWCFLFALTAYGDIIFFPFEPYGSVLKALNLGAGYIPLNVGAFRYVTGATGYQRKAV